jgi:hypothetical protein
MKTNHIQSRLGTTQIWIDALERSVQLPDNFLIYCYTNRMWIGGSRDDRYYLYLEKLPNDGDGVSTVLAIPEIELFFCSVGPAEKVTSRVHLVPVSGGLSSRWVEGYLAHVNLEDQGSYLMLVADSQEGRADARDQVMAVVQKLLQAAA